MASHPGCGEQLLRWIGALGDVAPCRAALLDSWGDERSVWIDFVRSDGEVRGPGYRRLLGGNRLRCFGCSFAGEQQITEDRAAGRRDPVCASGDGFLAALREAATIGGAGDSTSR